MNRKQFVIILILSAAGIAGLLVTRRHAHPSIFGRWHQVSPGGEQMTFMGEGDVQVSSANGSYTWIDDEHLRIELFAMGSPRLVWFSPRNGEMMWTNHELGLVLRYTNEPGSSAKVRISKALGL